MRNEERERERERERGEREREREGGGEERGGISHQTQQTLLSLRNDPLGQRDWRQIW